MRPASSGFRGSFSILAVRDFQYLLIGNTMTFAGFQVRQMAIAWLVLEATDSSLKAGIVNATPGIAIIVLSLFAGAISDRSERWRIIFVSRFFITAFLLVSAILVATNVIQWWHFIPIGVGIGVMFAFHNPASQTYAMDVVGRERIIGAAALNTAISNLANIAAPAAAGYLLVLGIDWAFWLLVVLYGTSFLAIIPIRKRTQPVANPRSIVSDMKAGLKYVGDNPAIKWLLIVSSSSLFNGMFLAMIPIFARDIFDVGAGGYGQMLLFAGIGSLVGAVGLTFRGEIKHKGLVILGNMGLAAVAIAVFGVSRWWGLSLAAVFITGMCQSLTFILAPTVIQTSSTPEMRGRVMGIFFMVVLVFQLGWIAAGALDTAIGTRETTLIAAIGAGSLAALGFAVSPALRKLT